MASTDLQCSHCSKLLSDTPENQKNPCTCCYQRQQQQHHSKYYKSLNYVASGGGGGGLSRQKKRALLIGVSYKKQRYKLKGTINDVKHMRNLLTETFKFPKEYIRVLTEEEEESRYAPTRKNIQEALQWLVQDCQSGDSLVFYYSGHGLQQFDFNQDERDGFDETLCPVDFKKEGMILDNDINTTIVRPLKKGVTLHAIVDACHTHSGIILDLVHVYDRKKKEWVDNSPPTGAEKGTDGGLAICFSACEDHQLAAETSALSGNVMSGVMTYSLISALKTNSEPTYGMLLDSMQEAFDNANKSGCVHLKKIFGKKIFQKSQLSSSERFDVDKKKFEL